MGHIQGLLPPILLIAGVLLEIEKSGAVWQRKYVIQQK